MIPPGFRHELVPADQIRTAASFAQEFDHPFVEHTVFVEVVGRHGVGIRAALEVAPANLVDQAGSRLLVTGTQLALGKHVVDLREADDRAIGIPAQQLVVEVGLRRLHQAYARILLAVGHRRGKLGDGIVFGAHFRETGDLVGQVDHLAAILLLPQALLGRVVGVGLVADEEHAFVFAATQVTVGLFTQVLVVEFLVGIAQFPLRVVASLGIERRREHETVVACGLDTEIFVG